MEYGKLMYKKKKQTKQSKNKPVKTIKLRPSIDTGDLNTKIKSIEKFLAKGHKVKVLVLFKGREHSHAELGIDILEKIEGAIAGYTGGIEKSLETFSLLLLPPHSN